jgi:hypothetical protein
MARVQADADARGEIGWVVCVDGTVVRAHQHAAGARRQPSKADRAARVQHPAGEALGRSSPTVSPWKTGDTRSRSPAGAPTLATRTHPPASRRASAAWGGGRRTSAAVRAIAGSRASASAAASSRRPRRARAA